MYLLIGVLIVILFLLVWVSPVQNFVGGCQVLDIIELDSGIPGPCLGIIAGVHGNEPAGSILLTSLIETNDPLLKPSRGKIIIIPRANQCGLTHYVRNHPSRNINTHNQGYDLNRNFNEYGGVSEKSNRIAEALQHCSLILDFHEGWGWYAAVKNKGDLTSLGSTMFGTNHPLANSVTAKTVYELNKTITDPNKKFVQLFDESCKIESTLACHFEKNNKAHIVIETSGQNDIQPLHVRTSQIKKVIEVARYVIHI